jgi:hypothetical protein
MRLAPVALLAATALALTLGGCGSSGDEDGAIAYCHQFVEQQLKSPSSADFPSFPDHQVTEVGEMHWRVSSYVNAEEPHRTRAGCGGAQSCRWHRAAPSGALLRARDLAPGM